MKKIHPLSLVFFLLGACLPLAAQQTLQIVNDAAPVWSDEDVYLLFTANPASVTANGSTISGVRDGSLPIGTVGNATSANGSTLVSQSFTTPPRTLPKPPFPIQFLSGNNSHPVGNATAAPVFEVTHYEPVTGTFKVNGTLLPMTTSDQFVVGAYSQKLSTFPVAGNLTSSLSGRSQRIYEVTLGSNFASGVVFVSYGAPLTYTTASPSPSRTKTLFQIFEVTTANGAGDTTSDLTYIDAYGFPLQIESIDDGGGKAVDRRTFYFSGNTVAADLNGIGTLTTNATVLRLGPGQFAAAHGGNPSPFPSFSEYLQAVHAANKPQVIAGTQAFGTPNPGTVYGVTVVGNYTQTYAYTARLSATGGNFTYTLTPSGNNTITGDVPPYFPPIADVTSLTVNLPADSLNETIYGCTLNSQSFQVHVSGNHSLVPTTFSGNFAVSSYSSNSIHSSDSSLTQLAVAQLGGTWLKFLTGNLASHAPVAINSGSLANGTATIALTDALPADPKAGDRFEVLFQVDSPSNTVNGFQTTQLGSANLNFITGNITFVQCNANSSNNTGETVAIASVDSVGNVQLQKPLKTAPVAGDIFRIEVADDDVQTQLYTNSGFAWVAADVMSALNLGFIGGTAGDSSAEWFGQFPQKFPYGLARPKPDDGYYNPWGAYFYNASDAYAFAFSDRIEPGPLLSTSPGNQTLRLTILPHDQIDAPLVTATTTNSSMSLEWDPQPDVVYHVETVPGLPAGGNATVHPGKGSALVSGLPPGTPFEISVFGTKGNQTSYTLPQIFSTGGNAVAVTGTKFFQIQLIWAGGASVPLDYRRYNVLLNGLKLDFTGEYASATANPIQVSGGNGTNLYVMDVIDTLGGNQTVMKSVLEMKLSGVTYNATTGGSFKVDGSPVVLGSDGAVQLNGSTIAPETYNIPPGGLSPLVVAINFSPVAAKQFAPVVLPALTPKGGGGQGVEQPKNENQKQLTPKERKQEIKRLKKRSSTLRKRLKSANRFKKQQLRAKIQAHRQKLDLLQNGA